MAPTNKTYSQTRRIITAFVSPPDRLSDGAKAPILPSSNQGMSISEMACVAIGEEGKTAPHTMPIIMNEHSFSQFYHYLLRSSSTRQRYFLSRRLGESYPRRPVLRRLLYPTIHQKRRADRSQQTYKIQDTDILP